MIDLFRGVILVLIAHPVLADRVPVCNESPCGAFGSPALIDHVETIDRPLTNRFVTDAAPTTGAFVSGFMGTRVADAETMITATDASPLASVEAMTTAIIFDMRVGETLRQTLERWLTAVDWQKLVWDVRNRDDAVIEIPIEANHTFNCGFMVCLSELKRAYALAPEPIFLEFDLRRGNRVLTVRNLSPRETR